VGLGYYAYDSEACCCADVTQLCARAFRVQEARTTLQDRFTHAIRTFCRIKDGLCCM
jgi:hypothetical protein